MTDATKVVTNVDFVRQRPEPPSDITPKQAKLWKKIVDSEPAELFVGEAAKDLLRDYVRARETCTMLSVMIDAFDMKTLEDATSLAEFKQLTKLRDSESRLAMIAATRLRMTNQARISPRKAGRLARDNPQGPQPWDFGR